MPICRGSKLAEFIVVALPIVDRELGTRWDNVISVCGNAAMSVEELADDRKTGKWLGCRRQARFGTSL
jgi:hypothetical protein